jgi:hypothetical protein
MLAVAVVEVAHKLAELLVVLAVVVLAAMQTAVAQVAALLIRVAVVVAVGLAHQTQALPVARVS